MGSTTLKDMQATVASFDESTRSGHVLTDDGVPLNFVAEALADHIRLLRIGQRVFITTDPMTVAIWQQR